MILDAQALFESDRLEQCSTQADLAYPRMLGVSDDWGRVEDNPRKILARAFPKRTSIRESDVRRWFNEYDRVRSPKDPDGPGLLRRYVVDGITYIEWWAWKGVPPSKRTFMRCPPPPWADPAETAIWEASRTHRTARRRARHKPGRLLATDGGTFGNLSGNQRATNGQSGAPQQVETGSTTSGELENQETPKSGVNESEVEPLLFRQVPAVPSVPAGSTKEIPVEAGGLVATGDAPPTHPPASRVLDHDPGNDDERRLAAACEAIARLDAEADGGRDVTDQDRRVALEAVSWTDQGKFLDHIRGAPAGWIKTSVAIAERRIRELEEEQERAHDPPRVPY